MSGGNDIFGNLDDFLENFDDNCLETSKLSDVENDFDRSAREGESSRGKATMGEAKGNGQKKKKDKTKKVPKQRATVNRMSASVRPSAASVPPVTVADSRSAASVPASDALISSAVPATSNAISTPFVAPSIPITTAPPSAPAPINGTNGISLLAEMQELAGMYAYCYLNPDPMVAMHLKNDRLYAPTKRSYTSLANNFHQKLPVTYTEIAKFRKRLEQVHAKLAQICSLIQVFISIRAQTSRRSTPAARRRSRRLVNTVQNSTVDSSVVITLDDDGPFNAPVPTSTTSGQDIPVIDVDALPNVITLDSEDETPPLESLRDEADNSFESENYEMRIKIKWVNRIEMFTLRKHQKFGDLIEKLATKEKADTKSILLNLNDRIIYADDTPDSIGYKTFQFISGRVLRDNAPIMTKTAASSNVNSISLKVQLANRKAPLRLQMDKNQTMIVLVIKCAEELKCKPEDIKLYFDGDLVDNGSKPEDLELEGDELLDIRLVR
ncbi:uncharacterized protein LOC131263511 [Anopheles coustani]|uniref:uncharacterized protein LOC131263511 n=2 Tax=coustani group TaxID=59130 RepID=UPI00265B15CB|nr:uncharacterized protein LOC131263511 [Anopheles coustani]